MGIFMQNIMIWLETEFKFLGTFVKVEREIEGGEGVNSMSLGMNFRVFN